MTDRLTIALAQFSQNVGDLRANADAMLVARSQHMGVDLIAFPELQLIGYPTEDLVLKPALHAAANCSAWPRSPPTAARQCWSALRM